MSGAGKGVDVAIVTLGCGRNEVDSDQVGGALAAAGHRLVADPADADCILVNTCTFIEPAREESIDTVLAACDVEAPSGKVPVLVMGCMAERYKGELAEALPEVAAVVGFADYPRLPDLVASAVAKTAPNPAGDLLGDRARLPLMGGSPAPAGPPTASFPVRTTPRGPWAYLKLAGGCDRACTFCTIPSYRGTFASRPLAELVAEAEWLVGQGVRELVCVSENTTSWGKDLPGRRAAQVDLVEAFGRVEGLERVRLMYLQPDEVTSELLDAMAASDVVAGYYDLSLQHASPSVVRRMARAGGAEPFLDLVNGIRARDPHAVFRSSFIVGFPGETEQDVEILEQFLVDAALDWAGFFTFSVEDGTPSSTMPDQVDPAEARARRDHLVGVAEAVAEERTAGFVGRRLDVLIEEQDGPDAVGRSYREAPETDGEVRLPGCTVPIGRVLPVLVTGSSGVDLVAAPATATGWRLQVGG